MMKRYGVLCMLLFFTIGIRFITVGQNGTDQDGKILQKLYSCYNLLQEPEYMNLSPEEYMRYFVDIEKKACSMIDSLSSVDSKKKAILYHKLGYLNSLGKYVKQKEVKGAATLEDELERRLDDLDIDSPDLDLLSDMEIMGLLDSYYAWKSPRASVWERSMDVLYNVKSEKVRRAYAFQNYKTMIQLYGYTMFIESLSWDFEFCIRDSVMLREVRELKEKYKNDHKK